MSKLVKTTNMVMGSMMRMNSMKRRWAMSFLVGRKVVASEKAALA